MSIWSILLCCLVAIIATTKASAQGRQGESSDSDCFQNIPDLDSAATKSLLDLLHQCQKTDDGVSRNCCSLVYPKIHSSSSQLHERRRRSPYNYRQNYHNHHHPHHHPLFRNGIYSPWFTIDESHEAPSSSKFPSVSSAPSCHPMTKNLSPATQNLLHKCCYIKPEVGVKVGLDCLALTFPTVPPHMRCGQCSRPGTVEDLVYECCNADDGIDRNCCALLDPYRNVTSNGKRPYCPCPRKSAGKNAKISQTSAVHSSHEQSEDEFGGDFRNSKNTDKKCHPSTLNLGTATQRLLNKCCLTAQATGKSIDCLQVAFPLVPWRERCGECDSDLPPKDLLNECCGTPDGISRDCCELVYPKLPKDQRFCPCSSQGTPAPPSPSSVGKGNERRQNWNYDHTGGSPFSYHSSLAETHFSGPGNNVPSFIYSLVRSLSNEQGGSSSSSSTSISREHGQCPLMSPEHAVNLHTYCCNTHGKKEYGFNCERLVLGKEPEHGNRPCGAWSNTLQPQSPTIAGNTDYLDYEDSDSNDY